jgi:hypothetical protein
MRITLLAQIISDTPMNCHREAVFAEAIFLIKKNLTFLNTPEIFKNVLEIA